MKVFCPFVLFAVAVFASAPADLKVSGGQGSACANAIGYHCGEAILNQKCQDPSSATAGAPLNYTIAEVTNCETFNNNMQCNGNYVPLVNNTCQ